MSLNIKIIVNGTSLNEPQTNVVDIALHYLSGILQQNHEGDKEPSGSL